MTGSGRLGSWITDHDLIAATHTSRVRSYEDGGRRVYRALYEDGQAVTFAVGHADAARVYAREYGTRIIGQRLVDCRWAR